MFEHIEEQSVFCVNVFDTNYSVIYNSILKDLCCCVTDNVRTDNTNTYLYNIERQPVSYVNVLESNYYVIVGYNIVDVAAATSLSL